MSADLWQHTLLVFNLGLHESQLDRGLDSRPLGSLADFRVQFLQLCLHLELLRQSLELSRLVKLEAPSWLARGGFDRNSITKPVIHFLAHSQFQETQVLIFRWKLFREHVKLLDSRSRIKETFGYKKRFLSSHFMQDKLSTLIGQLMKETMDKTNSFLAAQWVSFIRVWFCICSD